MAYKIVTLGKESFQASELVFTRDTVRTVTPAGPRSIPTSTIDWYETFYENIKAGTTNVVAFQNGSQMRFDRFDLKDGNVTLTVGGGQVTMLESLIDFEKSVREGAMVKLPEGAGTTVAVSRSDDGGGGGYQPDDDSPPPDDGGGVASAPASRTRRGASLAARRRAAMNGTPAPPEDAPEQGEMPMEEGAAVDANATPASGLATQGARGNLGGSRFGRKPATAPAPGSASGGNASGDGNTDQGQGNDNETQSGQAVVTLSTDYSGPLSGIQLVLQYPPNLQVVEPITFTGFAANWMTTPNATVPGQITIGGVTTGTDVSGGEFFRATFVWTGQPPARQLFRITQMKASLPSGEATGEFRTTMDVQISP
jgi:hypothetical protein